MSHKNQTTHFIPTPPEGIKLRDAILMSTDISTDHRDSLILRSRCPEMLDEIFKAPGSQILAIFPGLSFDIILHMHVFVFVRQDYDMDAEDDELDESFKWSPKREKKSRTPVEPNFKQN